MTRLLYLGPAKIPSVFHAGIHFPFVASEHDGQRCGSCDLSTAHYERGLAKPEEALEAAVALEKRFPAEYRLIGASVPVAPAPIEKLEDPSDLIRALEILADREFFGLSAAATWAIGHIKDLRCNLDDMSGILTEREAEIGEYRRALEQSIEDARQELQEHSTPDEKKLETEMSEASAVEPPADVPPFWVPEYGTQEQSEAARALLQNYLVEGAWKGPVTKANTYLGEAGLPVVKNKAVLDALLG